MLNAHRAQSRGMPQAQLRADCDRAAQMSRASGPSSRIQVMVIVNKDTKQALMLIIRNVVVNGTEFRVTLTDQTIRQVGELKNLYAAAYEDPESFDQISSQTSALINSISSAAEPTVSDNNLDGFIQEVIAIIENRKAVVEELASESKKARSGTRRRSRRSKS